MTKPKITKLDKSELEIEWEIPAGVFGGYKKKALQNLGQETKIDGFRPGHIPDDVLRKHLGDEKILFEMAQLAISESYPQILSKEKIDAIGRPEITITKIARNNDLGVKAKTAVMPKVELGDYKTAAKKVRDQKEEPVIVTDEEIQKVLEDIQKSRVKEGEPADKLPEINDDFAKSLGDFDSLEALKKKIGENLKQEKEHQAHSKKRAGIIDAVNGVAKTEIPAILTDYELDKMLAELKSETERMGLTLEKYLEHLKKTEADLRATWRADAEKRVKTGLVLDELAKLEKIAATTEEIEKEVAHLLEHYKEADPKRIRDYVTGIITNNKVLQWLEGDEKKS